MENPPSRASGDTVHAFAKAIAGSIPSVGGPLSVLLETVFAPPIERRRDKWFKEVAEVISKLEQHAANVTAEKLSQNEVFVTVAMQATQIALRNHQDEKLQALRGAVLSSGLPNAPDEHLQLTFLRFIDEFTALHLVILALCNEPARWKDMHEAKFPYGGGGGVASIVDLCYPSLSGESYIYTQIARDLQARGLLEEGNRVELMMAAGAIVVPKTTQMGKAFLTYVSPNA